MATEFKLSTSLNINLVTPRGRVTEHETNAVTAPGALGEFEILPGHIPFLTALHPGVLTIGRDSHTEIYAVGRGYLRVDDKGAVEVLVQQASAAGDVDKAAAQAELEEANAELEKWKNKPQDGDWQNIKDRADWAQAQLDARARG